MSSRSCWRQRAIGLSAGDALCASRFDALAAFHSSELLTPHGERLFARLELCGRSPCLVLQLPAAHDLRTQPGSSALDFGQHGFQHGAQINRFLQRIRAHQAKHERSARHQLQRRSKTNDWLLPLRYPHPQGFALPVYLLHARL
jgi:hypothetical protein